MIHVTYDDARVVSGSSFDGTAEWEFTQRPDGHRYTFQQDETGMWVEKIQKILEWDAQGNVAKRSPRWSKVAGGGKGLRIGERDHYRDPSF